MQRDVIGFVTFNFVLGVGAGRMMHVALPGHVLGVDCDYDSAHAAGLRIPAHVITDLESSCHTSRLGDYTQHDSGSKNRRSRDAGEGGLGPAALEAWVRDA